MAKPHSFVVPGPCDAAQRHGEVLGIVGSGRRSFSISRSAMRTTWSFLRNKSNREILGWVGAGLVACIGGLWTAFVYFSTPNKLAANISHVEASCGSFAAGGNVSGSTITAGSPGNCPLQKPEKNP